MEKEIEYVSYRLWNLLEQLIPPEYRKYGEVHVHGFPQKSLDISFAGSLKGAMVEVVASRDIYFIPEDQEKKVYRSDIQEKLKEIML